MREGQRELRGLLLLLSELQLWLCPGAELGCAVVNMTAHRPSAAPGRQLTVPARERRGRAED